MVGKESMTEVLRPAAPADHRAAALVQLNQRLGVLFRRLDRLARETRRTSTFAVSGGDRDELHHFESYLIAGPARVIVVRFVFRHFRVYP